MDGQYLLRFYISSYLMNMKLLSQESNFRNANKIMSQASVPLNFKTIFQ